MAENDTKPDEVSNEPLGDSDGGTAEGDPGPAPIGDSVAEGSGQASVADSDTGTAGGPGGDSTADSPGAPEDPGPALPEPPPVDLTGLDDGSKEDPDHDVAGEVLGVISELQPLPGTQLPIGPFNDYAFVFTPYGEFGIPKGQKIIGFKEIKDHEGRTSYRALYGGVQYARTREERQRWLEAKEAERIAMAEQGR